MADPYRALFLRAAGEIVAADGLEGMTFAAVAERAGLPVGSLQLRFDSAEQLAEALAKRVFARCGTYVRERLVGADPSLPGVLTAYAHGLLRAFAAEGGLAPALLRGPGAFAADPGADRLAEIRGHLVNAGVRHVGEIVRPDARAALDTAARAMVRACLEDAARPDSRGAGPGRPAYARELADAALLHLRGPVRRPPGPDP
ncbi:TetR/AcrR family transcriptional regulator [Streptomyces albidoflavus]